MIKPSKSQLLVLFVLLIGAGLFATQNESQGQSSYQSVGNYQVNLATPTDSVPFSQQQIPASSTPTLNPNQGLQIPVNSPYGGTCSSDGLTTSCIQSNGQTYQYPSSLDTLDTPTSGQDAGAQSPAAPPSGSNPMGAPAGTGEAATGVVPAPPADTSAPPPAPGPAQAAAPVPNAPATPPTTAAPETPATQTGQPPPGINPQATTATGQPLQTYQAPVAQQIQQQQTDPVNQTIVNQANQDLQACKASMNTATLCCRNPAGCTAAGGGAAVSSALQTLSQLTAAGSAIAIGASAGNNNQLKNVCQVLSYVGFGSAVANVGAAGICTSTQGSCQDKCGQIKTTYQPMMQCTSGGPCGGFYSNQLSNIIIEASAASGSCDGLGNSVAQELQQGVAGGLGGQYATLCANVAAASSGFNNLDNLPVFNTDCRNPANANNPICLNCSTAAGAANPLCRGAAGTAGAGATGVSSVGATNFGTGVKNANVANTAGFDGNGQGPVTPAITPNPTTNSGVQQGGAGGSLLGASANSQGFGLPDKTPGRPGGYNTAVLQGVSGGGGYTVSQAPVAAAAGFSGYGTAAVPGKNGEAKPFDLRQYLPGGVKDPKRNIAGLGAPHPEMGNRFDDIFKRVNDRVQVLCHLDRLMDCNNRKK